MVPDLGELLASRPLDGKRSAARRRPRSPATASASTAAAAPCTPPSARSPPRRTAGSNARERLDRAPRLDLERRQAKLKQTAGRLRALSPRATLERGYAIVHGPEGVVTDSVQVESGTEVSVDLARGGFGARVEETR